MKNTILKYGLIAGGFVSVWMATFILLGKFDDFENGQIYGYSSMIIAFSMIFVAIKKYRDNHQGGFIDFRTSFKIGAGITLIASTMYVITWLICYFNFASDFVDKYTAFRIEKMKAMNASQIEIDKMIESMKSFGEMYDNPIYNALMTYTEILPVGLLVTLLCSLILKRKKTVV